MAISKQKKVDILSSLGDKLKAAKSIVFVNFHGIPVATITEMRNKLRTEGTGYVVAKKTLIRLAFSKLGLAGELPALDGEIAVAYGDDDIAPARGIYEYQKKSPEMIKIVGGVFEGKIVDQSTMMSIATIPGREGLYGQFVNVINSPIQGFVMLLSEKAKLAESQTA